MTAIIVHGHCQTLNVVELYINCLIIIRVMNTLNFKL